MFPEISKKQIREIKDKISPEVLGNSREYFKNFYSFVDELLSLFPKNDFISLWYCFSFSFIKELFIKHKLNLKDLEDDASCYLEGEKLLDISFCLHIPECMFKSVKYEKTIGTFGEVGRELSTIHMFVPRERILEARKNAVTTTFEIDRYFSRIDLSVDFNGMTKISFYQFDEFDNYNLSEYKYLYEIYFDKLKSEILKIDLSEKSKIVFWSPEDSNSNGHKRDKSSFEGNLDIKDSFSILRLIYSYGFMIGDFPKI
ncbi:MAG: hypothetical protein WCO35_02085 [Candidatus Nomurabacteria bacterium]